MNLSDQKMFQDVSSQPTIETGYFIFTLMPSLRCELNCPHCYLSLEQRRSSEMMSINQLREACERIAHYYSRRELPQKKIVCYWYGGEPTTMGLSYMTDAVEAINHVFRSDTGYEVTHQVLTSFINVDQSWYEFFHRYCGGYVQTSYDGPMRGRGYLRKWEEAVRLARATGLRVGTISVVNHTLLEQGAVWTYDYLSELGIHETSWLPFMLNEQNKTGSYQQYAAMMNAYSSYMIDLTKHYYARRRAGDVIPYIGQREFIVRQGQCDLYSNIAGQTLFLLPNGDYALPDYRNGHEEYLNVFGNAFRQSFDDLLASPARRQYIRKQLTRSGNPECVVCQYSHQCLMEFWKQNRPGDDCFGASRYVDWLCNNTTTEEQCRPSLAILS